MKEKILYQETRKSTGITIILGIFTLLILAYLVIQLIVGPIGTKPVPPLLLAIIAGLFLLLTLNFYQITLTLTDKGMKVYYGVLGTTRQWKEIKRCEHDDFNAVYGWGIRFGKYKDQWVWVYNVIGGPRVAFVPAKKKPRGIIVSTLQPDRVIETANNAISNV